jgi:acyl-CoA thioester hydrolase
MSIEEFKSSQEHTLDIAIAWGDMDALGHVNNALYVRYFETARIDFLRDLNSLMPMPRAGIGPVLAYIDCQFLAQVTFPDTILVGSTVTGIGNTSVKMTQTIYSTVQQKIVAESKSVLVVIDYLTGAKVTVPDEIRKRHEEKLRG